VDMRVRQQQEIAEMEQVALMKVRACVCVPRCAYVILCVPVCVCVCGCVCVPQYHHITPLQHHRSTHRTWRMRRSAPRPEYSSNRRSLKRSESD
jgi:hypothetical protein